MMMSTFDSKGLRLSVTLPFLIAFVSLRHIFHELHEFAHMITGRLICGSWGARDFNRVQPIPQECGGMEHLYVLASMAGPLFNYIMIWIGAWLLINAVGDAKKIALGLLLIFASLPFARLFTVLVGGGDELGIFRLYISDPYISWSAAVIAVSLLLAYPLYKAFEALPGERRVIWFVGFLLLPMFLEGAVVLGLFNYLLGRGLLSEAGILGAPVLVSVVFFFSLFVFFLYRKSLLGFIRKKE